MAFKSTLADLSVLVIDDMPMQQATLRSQLTTLQVNKVDVATTAEDAVRMIKSRAYSVVMCDFNLNQKSDGQQLLEHLRENALLPPESLFFMVTAENAYAAVASASEHKPDAYLLKPVTANDIEERLKAQTERRNALLPIHLCLGRDDATGALAACDAVIAHQVRWTMHALQLKAQTLLRLGRHEDASEIYGEALGQRPGLIWAQLGMAKAQKAAGNLEDAKGLAYGVMQSKEGEKTLEAYDIVAQCLEAQGDLEGAMWVMRDSATVMPSARRQRLLGECAYRNDDLVTAKECFAKVVKATKGSITSQSQDTLTLAQIKTDAGEVQEVIGLLDAAVPNNRHDPQFANVALAIKAQAQIKAGDLAGAQASLARARQSKRPAKADFATIALAKAELLGGDEAAGLKMLETAVSADHENPRIKQLIGKVLRDTGREHLLQQVVDAAVKGLNRKVTEAKTMFSNSQIDEALSAIEEALREYPENTGVLLQAAQMNCMSLRLKKQLNVGVSQRVRTYLTRLDGLMPGSDRVAQMHRYYRETIASLKAGAAAATPVTSA